jgi:hypothetical protein
MKAARDPLAGGLFRSSEPIHDENNLIPLSAYSDCTERYHGMYTGASLFVLGRLADSPTFYLKKQREAAVTDALTTKRTLDTVAASSLCHDAMVEFLGA